MTRVGGERVEESRGAWTRGGFVRLAGGAGAALAGGIAIAAGGGDPVSRAAPSEQQDVRLLNFFLLLERLQEGLYTQAVERGAVSGALLRYATAALGQEREHIRILQDRLGGNAEAARDAAFDAALESPDGFKRAAIELEESGLAAYIAYGARLTRPAVAAIVPIISVDARHAAWVRDVAGVGPAPRAADPPRESQAILDDLRKQGLTR
jgi:hypothetical protein